MTYHSSTSICSTYVLHLFVLHTDVELCPSSHIIVLLLYVLNVGVDLCPILQFYIYKLYI